MSISPLKSSDSVRMVSLGSRLLLCASMVRRSSRAADIGTDHAYLPIYLVQNGLVSSVIASDVREKPLKTAARNIRRFKSDIITVRLSDGLSNILPDEADDIIIAGMGGKSIINIIKNAPWLKDRSKHLIIQPMTSEPELRLFLSQNGFAVKKEMAAAEDRHVYTAMLAAFGPENIQTGEIFPYVGKVKPDTRANRAYIAKQLHRLQKRADGLRVSGSLPEAEKAEKIISEINKLRGGV